MKLSILIVLVFAIWLAHCHQAKKMKTRKIINKYRNQNQNRWIIRNTNITYKLTINRAIRIIRTKNNKRKLTTRRLKRNQHLKANKNGNKKKLTLSQKRARNNKRPNKINNLKRKDRNNNNEGTNTMTPSDRIREYYNEARWIQKPMLYGFSTTEADKFVSRFDEDLPIPTVTPQCTNQKTNISTKDISDLCRILRTSQCKVDDTKKTTTPTRSRKRRSTSQTIVNSDGSITRIRRCVTRGAVTAKGYIRLCSQCHAVTELQNQMYVLFCY